MRADPAPWVARYVGLLWQDGGRDRDGLDCWGLCILVYREVFALALPDLGYAYQSAEDALEVGRLVAARRGDLIAIDAPSPGDFVFMSRWRSWPPHHVGLAIGGCRVIHAQQGMGSVVEDWRSTRFPYHVEGFYRHPALAAAA